MLQEGIPGLRGGRSPDKLRVQRISLAVAIGLFVGGIAFSVREMPASWATVSWPLLLPVVIIGIPVGVWINAVEFILTGRLVSRKIPLSRAIQVTIVGTAANLLPLPGAMMVRVGTLRLLQTSLRDGASATLLAALVWIGVAFAYAGTWISFSHLSAMSILFLLIGLGGILLSAIAARRMAGGAKTLLLLIGCELVCVLQDAFRLYFCFQALGVDCSVAQVSGLTVAAVVAAMVTVVPGGLGITEVLAAALSSLVGLDPALGFLAASLNRMLALVVIAPLAALLASRIPRDETAATPPRVDG